MAGAPGHDPPILPVGECSGDLRPAGERLGGATANFAHHCRALGADARPVTQVGDEDPGREVLERFRQPGLPTGPVQVDPAPPTGAVAVALAPDGQPRSTIREDFVRDGIAADAIPDPDASKIKTVPNGQAMRDGNARDMILDVPTVIEFFGGGTQRRARDGDPGRHSPRRRRARMPPAVLQPGDAVTVVSEGIAASTDPVVEGSPAP